MHAKFATVETPSLSAIELTSIVVPPEITDLEAVIGTKFQPSSSGLRGDEGVGYEGVRLYLKLFDDDVSFSQH